MLDYEKENMIQFFENQPDWLQKTIENIDSTGWAAEVYDADWNLLWISPELKIVLGEPDDSEVGYGEHIFSVYDRSIWRSIIDTDNQQSYTLESTIPYILYDTPQEEINDFLNRLDNFESNHIRSLKPLISAAKPIQPPPFFTNNLFLNTEGGPGTEIQCMSIRLYDQVEKFVGTLRIYGPGIRASVLSLVARGDETMFERMSRLVVPGKQRVAVLFADIDASTKLSKQLPTAVYFKLISTLTKRIDEIIIKHCGIVGKHVGDGTSAFFLADDHGAISSATRAAVVAAKEISDETEAIFRSILKDFQENVSKDLRCLINIGVHWGDTVYMGQIVSGGRLEVTALGDQVNECARIEQTAKRGEVLASKEILERLSENDAKDLGIDVDRVIYKPLKNLDSATEKSKSDAGNLAVVDLRKIIRD